MLHTRTMWVAGVDGCKGGWICAVRETSTGALRFELAATPAALLQLDPLPKIVCVDIPIGLPEAGRRECDVSARERLGWPRRSSVFPAPIRPSLNSRDREEASRITEAVDGRRVGAQGWALYPKIRAVDELLTTSSAARRRIREVHPEVCFWAWNGGNALREGKQTLAGKKQRLRLAETWLGTGVLTAARCGYSTRQVADDDILDAIAALWTATRIAAGTSETLPRKLHKDATGIPMQIVY